MCIPNALIKHNLSHIKHNVLHIQVLMFLVKFLTCRYKVRHVHMTKFLVCTYNVTHMFALFELRLTLVHGKSVRCIMKPSC